jgi:hypothetical protein
VPPARGQSPERVLTPNYNGWYMYFGDHPVRDGPWGVHLEGQWRRHDAITKGQQLLLRPGVNYEVSENLLLSAGYAFVDTFRYGEFPVSERFPEHRVFQQALLRHSVGRAGLSHRYRLEQRFLGEVSRDQAGERQVDRWRHENRFRYMFRVAVPLQGDRIETGKWYLALYDEVFVNFGKNVAANLFDQNRAYAALGYAAFRASRIELGYLNQLVQQRNGRILEVNHTVQVGWFSTLSFGGD